MRGASGLSIQPTAAATGRCGVVGVAALEHPHAVQAQLHERGRVHVEQREAVLELREALLVGGDDALGRGPEGGLGVAERVLEQLGQVAVHAHQQPALDPLHEDRGLDAVAERGAHVGGHVGELGQRVRARPSCRRRSP